MITSIILILIGFGILGLGLLWPSNYNVIGPDEQGYTMFFGKVSSIRGPGPTLTWPWEDLEIRPVNDQEIEIVVRLTTGFPDPMEFGIKLNGIIFISDVVASVYGFRGDLQHALQTLAQSSLQEELVRIGGNALLDKSLPNVLVNATRVITEIVTAKWGITFRKLTVGDIDLPQVLIDATKIRQEASAKAEAILRLSEAEITAYEAEFKAQGNNYRLHQLFDTLRTMSQHGAFKYVGDLKSIMTMDLIDKSGA